MPISLECPGCGREYRVRDELVGRRVKCRCGAVITVTDPATEPSPELELDDEPPRPAPPKPSARPPQPDTGPGGFAPEKPIRPRKPLAPPGDRGRIPVGVLSILYGTAAALVMIAYGVINWPVGLLALATRIVLAVLIAVGGVLILMRHPHGSACAGLCCVFLFFFRLWIIFIVLLAALTTGQFKELLLGLAWTVVIYSIPVYIAVWCLRQETTKQIDSEPPLY